MGCRDCRQRAGLFRLQLAAQRGPELDRGGRTIVCRRQGRHVQRQLRQGHQDAGARRGPGRRNPAGQQATLDLAYAQYRTAERAAALATLDRFIKQYPSSPALDYAFYLRGLVNFNDNLGILGALAQQDLSERDQQASRDAYQSFKQLVTQFPQSRYADEGRGRMNYIVNALADYEVHVARYYLRRGAFLAAANRAQQVVQEYPQTPANEEALFIMQLCYERLGLEQLRADTERVFKQNFPTSRFSAEGVRQSQRAWWRLW